MHCDTACGSPERMYRSRGYYGAYKDVDDLVDKM
jgi:hypothetical protein